VFSAAGPGKSIGARAARKAVINGISMQFYGFIKNLRLQPMV
jgi:hypothetical protein